MTAAVVACTLGAGFAFAISPPTAGSTLAGWAALYAIPSVLILGRNVPLRRAVRTVGWGVLIGAPAACLYGLFSSAMSGYVGLVGGFALVMLVSGWVSFCAAAFPAVSSFLASMFDVGLPGEPG